NEGPGGTTKNFSFKVLLSAASGRKVTVGYATSDGTATQPSDYAAANGTLTFSPGVTSRQVAGVVNGAFTDEPNENVHVSLSSPTFATIADGSGVGTITNDDAVPAVTGFNPVAAKAKVTITILGSGFTGTTQVQFANAGGGKVTATTFSVVDD